VDVDLAECAIRAIDTEQSRLRGAAWAQSDGALDSATQRDAVLEHVLAEYHIALPDLKGKHAGAAPGRPGDPRGLKELLRIRMQACTTSTSKYRALIRAANGDGRLRGTVQFNGAGRTGRWAGRTFQPHNLPRPSKGFDHDAQLEAVGAIKAGVADLVAPNVMQLTSDLLRGVIVAGEDRKLCVADLSNIEGPHARLAGRRELEAAGLPRLRRGQRRGPVQGVRHQLPVKTPATWTITSGKSARSWS
jgi:DNA polymerase